nr:bioactive peptide 1 [Coturnix japonica=Japanese quails, oviduct, Peptide Partial, 26 aa] [Coturnix japonica]
MSCKEVHCPPATSCRMVGDWPRCLPN